MTLTAGGAAGVRRSGGGGRGRKHGGGEKSLGREERASGGQAVDGIIVETHRIGKDDQGTAATGY